MYQMKRLVVIVPLWLVLAPATGCSDDDDLVVKTAEAMMSGTAGNNVGGKVKFEETATAGEVLVVVDLTNVPAGWRSLQIHEKSDCTGDGRAAGALWDPLKVATARPLGHLGNVEAGADGRVQWQATAAAPWRLEGRRLADVILKSVVVHTEAFDEKDPQRDLGPRLGCGIILGVGL
jgi:Cu/Zn superoxide dismutase